MLRHGRVGRTVSILCFSSMTDIFFRAKYPLAVAAAVEKMFPGPNVQGYDIGCAFQSTMNKADFYSKTGVAERCDHTLPALHGYGHNRQCQLSFQVTYLEGAGLSDFEQCERFFSACNLVAPLTRHSTSFHRHQYLDLHFRHWNGEKLNALGKFIYEHYQRALNLLDYEGPKLSLATKMYGFTGETYREWTEQERTYLASLKREPLEDTLHCLYIESLQKLWKAK